MAYKLKNKKSKGLTLIEVIVSLALIFMVAAFLLTTLGQSFTMLSNTKQVTEDTFAMMKETEIGIQTMRQKLENGDPLGVDAQTFNVFGVSVKAYPQEQKIGNNRILSFVGEEKIPELPTPEITSLKISITPGNPDKEYLSNNTRIESEMEYDKDTFYLHMVTSFQWYVSKPGFTAAEESDLGDIAAPVFPDDYEIINGAKSDTLTNIKDEYRGRFFKMTATPASNYGKLGTTQVSNAVHILGVPTIPTAPILFHWDAGEIELPNMILGQMVPKWNDISGNNRFAAQEIEDKMPILYASPLKPDGPFAHISTQYISFDGVDDTLQMNLPSNVTTDNMSVFIVAKANKNGTVGFVGDGSAENMWELGNDYFKWGNEKLNSPYNVDNQTWHVWGGSVGGGVARISIDNRIWEGSGPDTVTLSLKNTQIGRDLSKHSNIDVAEVIAFRGALTGDEYSQMLAYLREKYGI